MLNWLSTPSLHRLVGQFGGSVPDVSDVRELSAWFLGFSDIWDFRSRQKQAYDNKVGEGARWLLSNDALTDEQKRCALAAASDLGLIGIDTPTHESYDYIWALGGARRSCLARARFAKQVAEKATRHPKAIVLLAALRPIGDDEREATNTYAPHAVTEFDLFVAVANDEFGVGNPSMSERYDDALNANNSWVVSRYPAGGYELVIIAAPSSEPKARYANSADTYKFYFDQFGVREGAEILIVTSQIYVPYQHLEAVRTVAIPHGVGVDTIGFDLKWNSSSYGVSGPVNYLQEIRSTIQAIDRFLMQYR